MSDVVATDNGGTEHKSKMCLACLTWQGGALIAEVSHSREGERVFSEKAKPAPEHMDRGWP